MRIIIARSPCPRRRVIVIGSVCRENDGSRSSLASRQDLRKPAKSM
jgi:hypothetical protein